MDDVQHDGAGTARTDGPGPRRTRRWALIGAAVATLAAASAGAALTLANGDGDGQDGDPADSLPSPRSITRDGVTYDVGLTSPEAAALDPDDPRAVTVYVFAGESAEQPECSMLEPRARIVEETSSAVRIATYVYRVPIEGDESISCGFASSTPGADYRAMTLHLSEPLGERRVIDERSGQDIGHLDEDYAPIPAHLPVGFRARPRDPMLDFFSGFTLRAASAWAASSSAAAAPTWKSRSGRPPDVATPRARRCPTTTSGAMGPPSPRTPTSAA